MASKISDLLFRLLGYFKKEYFLKLLRYYLIFAAGNFMYKVARAVYRYRRAAKCFKNIPGEKVDPFGTRILQNIHRVHDYVTDMALKHPKAPLVKLPGPGVELLCNTPESVEWMLKTQFKDVTKGAAKKEFLYKLLKDFLGEGIFTLRHGEFADLDKDIIHENEKWYNSRKSASLIFTKANMMYMMQDTFTEKANQLFDVLVRRAERGEPVDMQEKFFAFTMDSIQRLFFGNEVNTVRDGVIDPYADAFDEAHRSLIRSVYNSVLWQVLTQAYLPWPFGTLDIHEGGMNSLLFRLWKSTSSDYAAFKNNVSYLHKLTGEYIAKVRSDPNILKSKTMIGNILRVNNNAGMTDAELRAVVLNLTIAGRDTTACTLSWMFYLLSQNLDIQQKLCEEIDEKLQGRVPTLLDLEPNNMPYLNGVLYETLRLYGAVPQDEKFVMKDLVYLDGTVIPADTKLIFSPYVMGRNPTVYDDPLKVDPNRWIPFQPPSLYAFPVFQAGPRFCLGKDMAQFEAKLLASMLLQKFTFTMPSGEAEKITYSMMITMSIANSKMQDSHNLWLTPRLR